jgi:DNA-binding response OmpR family regulator
MGSKHSLGSSWARTVRPNRRDQRRGLPCVDVSNALLATDADWIFDAVDAALGGAYTVHRVRAGAHVLPAVRQLDPALVLLDMQTGNMGGMATCLNLRLEERAGRITPRRILMLLDREADIFLARRAECDGWLIKPLDAFRLRRAAQAVLSSGTYTEGLPATASAPVP